MLTLSPCKGLFFMKFPAFVLSLILIVLCFTSCGKNDFITQEYTESLKSTHAFVYRFEDGTVSKSSSDGSEKIFPASTTKLLTALAALDITAPDTLIHPGDEVYYPQEGSSSAYIRPNHILTLEMLIEAMMLPSGNDAAYAVSAGCGRILTGDDDSIDENLKAFVEHMNAYARTLGCTGSNFTVPDGYAGDEHYSTLDDMILISRAACEHELIMKYASMRSDDVVYASGHINTWHNTNEFINPDSEFFNENVIGMKTGSLSGYYTLISLYDDGEHRFLIGVFGSEKEDERYGDTERIINAEISALTD